MPSKAEEFKGHDLGAGDLVDAVAEAGQGVLLGEALLLDGGLRGAHAEGTGVDHRGFHVVGAGAHRGVVGATVVEAGGAAELGAFGVAFGVREVEGVLGLEGGRLEGLGLHGGGAEDEGETEEGEEACVHGVGDLEVIDVPNICPLSRCHPDGRQCRTMMFVSSARGP